MKFLTALFLVVSSVSNAQVPAISAVGSLVKAVNSTAATPSAIGSINGLLGARGYHNALVKKGSAYEISSNVPENVAAQVKAEAEQKFPELFALTAKKYYEASPSAISKNMMETAGSKNSATQMKSEFTVNSSAEDFASINASLTKAAAENPEVATDILSIRADSAAVRLATEGTLPIQAKNCIAPKTEVGPTSIKNISAMVKNIRSYVETNKNIIAKAKDKASCAIDFMASRALADMIEVLGFTGNDGLTALAYLNSNCGVGPKGMANRLQNAAALNSIPASCK